MALTAYSSVVQALVVVAGAVVLQQYTKKRVSHVLAAKKKQKEADKARDALKNPTESKRHSLPMASLSDLSAASAADSDSGPMFVVEIEYCTGCRWMLRAGWLAQELLTTFQADPASHLRSVVLTPNGRQGGIFQVYLHATDGSVDKELLWSRKAIGRFPESKELKQIVRDYINPDKGLGHSDKK